MIKSEKGTWSAGGAPLNIRLNKLEEVLGGLPQSEQTILYALQGHKEVRGWVEPGIHAVLFAIDAFQRDRGLEGGAIEIGIHYGRFFIALANLCEPDTPLVAIDVFENQDKNIDQSGRGNEALFINNLNAYCNKAVEEVTILKEDSLEVQVGVTEGLEPGRFRLISIDGGHTPVHTFNDLQLAERLLAEGGVVFIDDILHPFWMGVMEGVMRYRLFTPGALIPFLVTANKMALCKATYHSAYLEFFAKRFPMRPKKIYPWTGNMLVAGDAPVLIDGA